MFDQLIYVAIAGAIIIAILALIKVMIDYPGFGDWCMRFVHKKTESKNEKEGIEDGVKVTDGDPEVVNLSLPKLILTGDGGEKVDLRFGRSPTMSRTSTDPEICKRRLEELNEIISIDESPRSRLLQIRKKHHDRRHSHHHDRHEHHHHHHRRTSHDHHHLRHFYSHDKHHHHRHHRHGHHSSTESDSSPKRLRKSRSRSDQHDIVITSDDSQEKVNGDSPNSNNSLDKLKVHPKNNMRININNINILINRHLQNDVTINIDMDENNEAEIVEIDEHEGEHADHDHEHDHDHEVRSSDSGIGWDEHHVHDPEVHDHIAIITTADIEPIQEEEQERSSNIEPEASKKESFMDKLQLDRLPSLDFHKRLRHNTYS